VGIEEWEETIYEWGEMMYEKKRGGLDDITREVAEKTDL